MATTTQQDKPTRPQGSIAAIFERLLMNGAAKMSMTEARFVLKMGFNKEDQARMEDLAERNQEGALSPEEHEELMNYVHVGNMLVILQSRARKTLKKK